MKSLITSLLFIFSILLTHAQTKTITGTVTGAGLPIPSANILIKNTDRGTATDFDGNYSIEASPSDVLIFSYVGYVTKEIKVGDQTVINVELEEDLNQLDEIVLIGYGSVKKKDLTGAVSTVEGEELEKRTVTSIQETLSGQLPGVQVSSSGAPGSEAQVTVRGFSTLNNNSPLFVVDDVPLDDIGFLSPNDVESVQVLKDASATAIYGSRASNGVIIITTKRGKAGKLSVSVDAYSSFQTVGNTPDLANATEYARTINQGRLNDGDTPLYENPENFGAGTDWFDVVTQDALLNNIAINVNGGSEKIKVSSGLSYQTQDGLEKGSDFERITARLNSEFKILDNLSLTQSFSIGQSFTTNGPGLIFDALRLEPITSPYLPAYEQPAALNEFSIFSPTITDVPNALGRLARNFNEVNFLRGVGTLALNWEIIEGLSLKTQFSANFSTYEQNRFTPNFFIEPDDQQILNSVERNHNNRMNTVWNNILSYNKTIKDHDFGLMGGIIFEGREHRTLYGRGLNTPSNDPDLRFLDAATEGFFTSGNNENYNLISYIGRLNYNFKSKYLLTATFRADGSSLFPDDNKWGFFPSISGAWVVSDEDFINNEGVLSYLKLRAGWGQIGNDNRNSLPQNARLTTIVNDFTTVGSEQNLYVAAVPGNVGNANLQWETVEDINLGIDAKFFESKLGINLDVYQRKTFDMLMPQSIPAYLGSGFDAQWANVGNFETRGFDLGINFKADIGQVKSNFTLNISHFKPEATKLADGEAVLDGNDQRLDLLARTEEGRTPGQFFGFVTDGIFQNQTEINSHSDQFGNIIQPNAQPGDFRFRDLNGDGQLTDEDRTFIGDPTPDFTFGFKMAFEYKNFDFNALFTGTYGNDAINVARAYIGNGGELYNSYAGVLANSWNGEGSTNSEPRISIDDPNGNFRYSDYYVEDGSFLRFQNFQLGYSFPETFLKKAGLARARVYLSGENIFTLTSFSGLEVDLGGSATLRGVEYGSYPIPRTLSIGINLSL
jgi:TonB-linked SusC/RagA family outer membrane protein